MPTFNFRNEQQLLKSPVWNTKTIMDHGTEDVPLEGRSAGIDPGITEYRPTSPPIRVQPERRWLRVAVLTALAVFLALILYDALTEQRVKKASVNFVGWVEEHPFLGVIAVILAYIVATVLFVPASVLTLGTGYAFRSAFNSIGKGVVLASTAVFIGAYLGSICTFLLGRYLFRDCVLRLASTYPLFRAVDQALETNGLKIMILLRLSPLIPYNALDYISGVTSIPLRDYSLALIAILPGTILFCFVGATASSLADGSLDASGHRGLRLFVLAFGLVSAFAGVYAASYYSKLELDKILLEERAQNPSFQTLTEDDDSSVDGEESIADSEQTRRVT